MFSLTIVFGPGPMVWTLMFKDKENAEKAFAGIQKNVCVLENGFGCCDDFGQQILIPEKHSLSGMMLEDLEQSKLAHIERALHQTRTKVKADELAMADPVIKSAAMRAQGGGAILQPAMPGMPQPNGRWS